MYRLNINQKKMNKKKKNSSSMYRSKPYHASAIDICMARKKLLITFLVQINTSDILLTINGNVDFTSTKSRSRIIFLKKAESMCVSLSAVTNHQNWFLLFIFVFIFETIKGEKLWLTKKTIWIWKKKIWRMRVT